MRTSPLGATHRARISSALDKGLSIVADRRLAGAPRSGVADVAVRPERVSGAAADEVHARSRSTGPLFTDDVAR